MFQYCYCFKFQALSWPKCILTKKRQYEEVMIDLLDPCDVSKIWFIIYLAQWTHNVNLTSNCIDDKSMLIKHCVHWEVSDRHCQELASFHFCVGPPLEISILWHAQWYVTTHQDQSKSYTAVSRLQVLAMRWSCKHVILSLFFLFNEKTNFLIWAGSAYYLIWLGWKPP